MKKVVLLLAGILVLVLTGCGSNTENGSVTKSKEALVINNYGREIEFTEKPSKVLTLGPNATELFIALGLSDYIIGNSLDNHSRGALPEYKDDYEKIPELTYGSATREAVITSGADFIYGIDWEFGSEGLDVDELESYGINVYMNKATTMDEIYQEIRDIAMIFDIEDRAESFVEEQKARITSVQEKLADHEPIDVLVYDSGGMAFSPRVEQTLKRY